jgi:hypothetical protein
VPPVGDYFERLLEFAVWAKWGRRPVGRAEARAVLVPAEVPRQSVLPAAA